MLDENRIIDFSGNVYNKDEFMKMLRKYDSEGYSVYIGTDSQVIKNIVSIVTAICFHKKDEDKNASSKVFYMKEKIKDKKYLPLRSRMLLEAYRSIELAMEVDQFISGKLEVHLDIGDTKKSKTSAYERELKSLVLSQGYSCAIKPDSWASSSVADRVAKA